MERLFAMSDATALGDLEGAADHLRGLDGVTGRVGCIGFCMGGRYTLLFACASDKLERRRRLLGRLHRPRDARRALDAERARRRRWSWPSSLRCPLLAAVGAEDQNPSPELGEQLRERRAPPQPSGQEVKVDVYEGAGHAFFADYRPSYRPEPAAKLWARDRAVPRTRTCRPAEPARTAPRDGRAAPVPRSYSAVAVSRTSDERGGADVERKWWTLIAVSVAIFMLLLDITVVNVALPDIQRSLHSSFQDLQWVVNAYSLTLAAFLLTAGSLADRFGRRRVFVDRARRLHARPRPPAGWPSTPLALNLARAVQGIGGAMMFATSLALIASAFHGRERGIAFGVFGGVIGAAVAVGPVVGGVITSGIGWEWIFFVNVPIGIAAVVAHAHAGRRVARPERARRRLARAS